MRRQYCLQTIRKEGIKVKSITRVLALLLAFVFICSTGFAASLDSNATAAIALYIDTSGHYVPGMDLLNKALNEVIRFKVNALLLGSEVQSGNEVLRDLSRCQINTANDATPQTLTAYGDARHVNYILLLSVRPLDIALDVKAFSTASGSYLVDKTINRPDGTAAMSTLDTLSAMIGGEVADILQTIQNTAANVAVVQD